MKITSQKINNIAVDKIEYDFEGIKDYCYVEKGESDNYIVNFHGHGSHADQLYTREDIFKCWYPAIKEHGLGIINLEIMGNSWMNLPALTISKSIIDFLKKHLNINKLIFCGGSMGGTSALIYTIHHPNDVDGLITNCPCCNMDNYYYFLEKGNLPIHKEIFDTIKSKYQGNPNNTVIYSQNSGNEHTERLTMPMYLCHGDTDDIIPCSYSLKLIDKMKELTNFNYKIIQGGDHDAPLYLFPEEITWICEKVKI